MPDDTEWTELSSHQTIRLIREYFGMPEAKPGMKACIKRECKKSFHTIFVSGRSPEFYCPRCKWEMRQE